MLSGFKAPPMQVEAQSSKLVLAENAFTSGSSMTISFLSLDDDGDGR
jgi:hypothetical protein